MSPKKIRKERIVVKVGTSTITNENGGINIHQIDLLCRALSGIENLGYDLVLVSSGAIAVGAGKMRLKQKPKDLRLKQAAAAVGQSELMHLYDKLFGEYGRLCGQILLDNDDIEDPVRRENLKNTFDALLENHIIPIVNENDSVSHAEIESDQKLFSDNDMLSALVAAFCGACKLIILSDIDGFYDKNPSKYPDAKLISRVESIDDTMYDLADGSGSNRGTGGMVTKLQAAEFATARGVDVLITNGSNTDNLYDIINKKHVGTLFVAKENN
ncbi:glutamate 5-kinase [Butyrivibrio sp. INlla16]|uniref:glutamate 5-kinase n=1 Tax=Butyrivibrio sp. INlla16 TaxID=1520807 RepID=UPI0008924D9D|nr:glutamate 5-kinase [Butyrivibrio sp. INlla16]SDB31465.1 glutamate 5-kinase [Butyrivibrio sp. INlla16]